MSEEPTHNQIMRQLSILIYNQPSVQRALTEVSKAGRRREGLTEAGVNMVLAISEVAFAFSQDHEVMREAINASPTTAVGAAFKPGIYPAVALCAGDTILHAGSEMTISKVLAGRDEIQFTLENGASFSVNEQTLIRLVKPYEPNAE